MTPAVRRGMESAFRGAVALAGLVLAWAALALEPIEHPDTDPLSPGVARAISAARSKIEAALGDPAGSDYGELGMVYQAHEFNRPALQAYRHAAALTPNDARWPYLEAVIAYDEGRFDEALDGFSRSLAVNPDFPAARIRRARALLKLGRLEAAKADLRAVLEASESAVAHAELGEIALLEDDHQRAAEHLQQALALQPQARRLHYRLALAYRGLGEVERARAHLAQRGEGEPRFEDPPFEAMRGRSRSYAYYLSQGLSASRNRDYAAALSLMRQAVAANPDSIDARVHLARALEANGELDAARGELNAALERAPDHPLAHFNLGVLAEMGAQDEVAIGHYERSVAVQPELFEAQLLLANGLMRTRQFARASARYDVALGLRPERSELLLLRAVAEQAAGDCGAAVASLLELVRRLPEDPEALLAYSRCAATCPAAGEVDRENALNAARNLYRLYPKLDFVVTLAMAEAAHGNFELAGDYQAQALFLAARDGGPDENQFLGQLLERYQNQRPALRPWPADHPLMNPRRISPQDRL